MRALLKLEQHSAAALAYFVARVARVDRAGPVALEGLAYWGEDPSRVVIDEMAGSAC